MPIEPKIDPVRRRVHVIVSGEFSTADIINAITTATSDPDFRPGFNILSDHRQVTKVIQTDQVRAATGLLTSLSDRLAGARWAVIVGNSALQYGTMRMVSGYSASAKIDTQVFDNETDALAWLDQAPDPE